MRRAAKRDANEPEIIQALEERGCLVWQLSQEGIPDLLVVRNGEIKLLEVKNGEFRGKLTSLQGENLLRGLPFQVVQDKYQALHAMGLGKQEKKTSTVMWERDDGAIVYIEELSNSRNWTDEKLCNGTWKRIGVCDE